MRQVGAEESKTALSLRYALTGTGGSVRVGYFRGGKNAHPVKDSAEPLVYPSAFFPTIHTCPSRGSSIASSWNHFVLSEQFR
jgi:hypothetical protein